MTRQVRSTDIQFSSSNYEPEKMRRLVQELRALQSAVNLALQQLTVLQGSVGGVAEITGPALLGRESGVGAAQPLSPTQVTALLDAFTTALKGLVPAPGAATGAFLRDDGSWANPLGSVPEGYPAELGYAGL